MQRPDQDARNGVESVDTGDICGSKGTVIPIAKPSLYISNGKGRYVLRDDLVKDLREKLATHSRGKTLWQILTGTVD